MLTIAVCLKAAWRTDVALRLGASGNTVRPDGGLRGLTAPDRGALACALALGRATGSAAPPARLLALTVGDAASDAVLREALAAGADEAWRIWPASWPEEAAPVLDGSGAATRSRALLAAGALRERTADAPLLVLAGEASGDEGHSAFGACLARALRLDFAHRATGLETRGAGWLARVKLERGYTQEVLLPASAVVTLAGPGPRLPEAPWPAWLASRTAPITVIATEPASAGRDAPAARTLLRAPIPRVKRFSVPDASQPAEARIRALVGTQPQGHGSVIPASEGAGPQADAIVALLKRRGILPG